ncbi:MAG: hypothetical protein NTW03_16255 [Verrucomicrobia bacterium]|nr:hypothetical protein [Verrucomicrobiota bacterium]
MIWFEGFERFHGMDPFVGGEAEAGSPRGFLPDVRTGLFFAHVSRDALVFSTPLLSRIAVGCGSSTRPASQTPKNLQFITIRCLAYRVKSILVSFTGGAHLDSTAMMAWVSFGEMLLGKAGTEEWDKSIPAFLISSDFTKSSARSAMFIGCQGPQSPPFCFSAARLHGAGGITSPVAPLKNKKNEGEALL